MIILWTVTAVIGTVVSALQVVDLARRWWRIRQHDDNGVKPVLLTMSALTGLREVLRFLASLGLLTLGLVYGAAGAVPGGSLLSSDLPATFVTVVLLYANWALAVNSVLERIQARAEDRYIDLELGHVRTPEEIQEKHDA